VSRGRGGSIQFKCNATALTERVSDLEAGLLRPGIEGLGAGVRHGPAIVASDLVLRRAGGRDQEGEAGEPQATRPPRHGYKATRALGVVSYGFRCPCACSTGNIKSLGMGRDSPGLDSGRICRRAARNLTPDRGLEALQVVG
jgi:hypothetical protein